MTSKTINILLIEDNRGDYALVKEMLRESHLNYTLHWEQTLKKGMQYLEENLNDTILLDLGLPDSTGLETLETLVAQNFDGCIIVLTGNTNDQQGIDAMKKGAHDYLIKGYLNPCVLPRIIRYAIERKESEKILLNHQALLESEVARRTEELVKTNSRLTEEIATRIETEKNLLESEENFRLITTSAQDAIVKMDHYGNIAFWNPAAETIFGYTEAEVLGKDAHKLLTRPEDENQAQHGMNRFFESGKGNLIGRTAELMARRKDGEIIPIEISLSALNIHGNSRQAVGIIRDISERKLAEHKIKETNIFLNTLLDTLPIPIFYKNTNGKYEGGNLAFYNFLGKKPNEVIGKSADQFVANNEHATIYQHKDSELFAGKKKQVYESVVVNSFGVCRDVIFHKAIYKNGHGEIAGLVGAFIDITESKQTTSELKLLKENLEDIVEKRTRQLQEANATKDKFFSIIAHDLKSPFNVIQGFLSLIYEEYDDFSTLEIKDFIKKTLDASINTFSLLENLLEWSRSQQGNIEFDPATIDLCSLCEEIIDLNLENAGNKSIGIVNQIDTFCKVFADANMVKTILRNLLTNAIKFSISQSTIFISAKKSDKNVVVCVRDQGTGIEKSDVAKLFNIKEKFQRPGTQKEKGTGLGLILCKEFIEKNGGKIWVESEKGKGSSFYFSLPLPAEN